MKCFAAIVLLALFAVAFAAESPEQSQNVQPETLENAPRDKRGVLLGGAYTAPIAYAAYSAPAYGYSAYNLPYAYRTYSYPYHSSAYIYG